MRDPSRFDSLESLAGRLRARSAALNAYRILEEPSPSSRVPLLGTFVSLLRRLVYRWMLRWYMVPVLDQQRRFSQEITAAFDELAGIVVSQQQKIAAACIQDSPRPGTRQGTWPQASFSGDERFTIAVDYPVSARPRYGYGRPPHAELCRLIASGWDSYRDHLTHFLSYRDYLARIARRSVRDPDSEPVWMNEFLVELDAVSLYGFVAGRRPRRYYEIGSGNSTKFVRRAIRDHGLDTVIVSVDPWPRAEIDSICDQVIRQPVEDVDVQLFDHLERGDILFVDHSHRVFMNSDATVVFLDILPRLKPGVLVGFHDVFLPYDYPAAWADRYYSEQYVLAAYLLGGTRFEIVLPCAFVGNDPELAGILAPLWAHLGLEEKKASILFWIQVGAG